MKPWRVVAILSISETVAWGALYYSFGVLLQPFASYFAASEATIAGAFSLAVLGAASAAWIAGTSMDRWGPRLVMTTSALLGVGALASLAAVDTIAGFYIAWALIGVSHAGVLYEPAFTVIAKSFPRAPSQRARALLILTSVAGFASTIFVPLTATLFKHFGLQRTVLLLATLVGLIVLPLNAMLPRHHALVTAAAAASSSTSSTSSSTLPPTPTPTTASPRIAVLTIVFSLQAFASAGVTVHLVSHLREDSGGGLDLATAATIAGLMGAAQVPARLGFGVFQRFVTVRSRLPLLLGVQTIALIAVVLAGRSHVVVLTFGVLLLGAANGLLTLERAVVIADSCDTNHYGKVSGRIATFAYVTRAAAPLTVGLVKVTASSYTIAFLGLAALSALAAAISGWTDAARARAGVRTLPCREI